ncbi:MAG TPA: hypothetical protein VGG19_12165 [Tepidisphaeraceae bacterium]|jgi:hypothetical protein
MPSSPSIYLQIKHRYGFNIPADYRYMDEKGWFEAEVGIKYGGPNYMWVNDMEWLTPNEIRDYTRLDEWTKPGFAPFAISAGGDHWCWYTPASTNCVAPVVLCPRDYYVGEFYAPNFIGSLYRQMLEYVIYCDPEVETEIRAHLKRWQECFAPLFPARWIETLSRLHDTPIAIRDITGSGEHWKPSLLSSDDYHAIVDRDLAFDMLDKEIRWMRDFT